MPRINVIILDLDNTLYDWIGFYIPSFHAMLSEIHRLTSIPTPSLLASFKRLHEKYRTTEYAFAIEELDVLRDVDSGLDLQEVLTKYSSAINAFREVRREKLRLYPGVKETLSNLSHSGRQLVATTDALMFYAVRRLKDLGIEEYFNGICAPKDHGVPDGVKLETVRNCSDPDRYRSSIRIQMALEPQMRKPNPVILHSVLKVMNSDPINALMVGDSVSKDVWMAKQAGIWDVFARYGTQVSKDDYEQLLAITYWTAADVANSDSLSKQQVSPSFSIDSFHEIESVIREIESQ